MSTKKRVLENSFLYTFSSIIMRATSFLLLPLYTNFLTPEEYGIVNLIHTFLEMSILIVSFSLSSGIIRFYVDLKENREELRRYIGTVINFITISSIFFSLIGLIFNQTLANIFFDNISFYPYIFIALITITFLTLHKVHGDIMQAKQQGRKLTIVNLIVFFNLIIMNIFFIIILKLGAVGMLLAQMFVYIGYLFYMIYDLKKNRLYICVFDTKKLWEALKYSIPLMPHDLSTRIASFVSRSILNISGTIALVGLYSVSLRFGILIDTIQASVNNAYRPWFFEMLAKNDLQSKKQVLELTNILLLFYSIVYLVIGLFSQEAIFLMTSSNFILAWTVIPILVIAYSIKSLYYFFVNILFYYKSLTKKVFISTLVGSFSDILLAIFLIPKYGMYGAALAFLIAKIIVVIIVYFMARQNNDVGFNIWKMLKIICLSLAFMLIGLYFSYVYFVDTVNIYNLLYKFIILFVYISLIYYLYRNSINTYINKEKIAILLNKFKK